MANQKTRAQSQFRALWWATNCGVAGSAISAGVFLMIAINTLNAPRADVVLVSAIAAIVGATCCIPLTVLANRANTKWLLVTVETLRAATSLIIAALLLTRSLSLWQLAIGMAVVTALAVLSAALGGALVRGVVPEPGWTRANRSLATAGWVVTGVGTPLGGFLVDAYGPVWPLVLNAVAYAGAVAALFAVTWRVEARPANSSGFRRQVLRGWQVVWQHPTLRGYFLNAMWFGGCLALAGPLLALLVLDDLQLTEFHYSLILSVPMAAGLAGSAASTALARACGTTRVIWASGALRSVPLVLIACAPTGMAGFWYLLGCECVLMFAAGVFNPLFTTARFGLVAAADMVPVGAAWPITARLANPVFLLAGSVFVTWWDVRGALLAAGVLMLLAPALLPHQKAPLPDDAGTQVADHV